MKRIKRQSFLILSLALLVFAFNQSASGQQKIRYNGPTATVKGTIYIKGVSGNNVGKLSCENLRVLMRMEGRDERGTKWTEVRTAQGKGDFSKGKCSYSITVFANFDIYPRIGAPAMPCDQKSLEAYDPQVVLSVKPEQTFTFNFSIKKVTCTVLK